MTVDGRQVTDGRSIEQWRSGFSPHAGMVICRDGSRAADLRIERFQWNERASGVMRHADVGYEDAIESARRNGLRLPGKPPRRLSPPA